MKMKGGKTKDEKEKRKMSIQGGGVKPDSLNRRSSLRSSGHQDMLYDFKEDSPKMPDIVKQTNKKSGKNKVTRQTGGYGSHTNATKLSQKKGKREDLQVTPKVAGRKKITSTGENKDHRQNKVKKKIKPLPPPNFDDVSPIVMNPTKRRSNRSSKQQTPSSSLNVEKGKKTKKESNLSLDTPRLSFIEPEQIMSDDSAIFISPRQMRSRESTENKKTSTPAIVPCKMSKKDSKTKQPNQDKMVKDTSTPCEVRQTRAFTRLKTVEPECSPVQRNETPTSDYGSMEAVDSLIIPSPVSEKMPKRKRGSSPTPAFSLEDDYPSEAEPLSLNKSISINYSNKKTKKKMKTNRYSINKVEEWANKVNSELEDIENFELSIED